MAYYWGSQLEPDVPKTIGNQISKIREILNPVGIFWLIQESSNFSMVDVIQRFTKSLDFLEMHKEELLNYPSRLDLRNLENISFLLKNQESQYLTMHGFDCFDEFHEYSDQIIDHYHEERFLIQLTRLKDLFGIRLNDFEENKLGVIATQVRSVNKNKILWLLNASGVFKRGGDRSNTVYGLRVCKELNLKAKAREIRNWNTRGNIHEGEISSLINLYKNKLKPEWIEILSNPKNYEGVKFK